MTLLIIMSWIIYKESISHFHRIWKSSYSYPGLLFKQSQLLCGWWVPDSPEGWRSLYIYKTNASTPRGLGFPTRSRQCPQVPWRAQSLPSVIVGGAGSPCCARGGSAFELGVLTARAEPIPSVHMWQKRWKRIFSVSPFLAARPLWSWCWSGGPLWVSHLLWKQRCITGAIQVTPTEGENYWARYQSPNNNVE